MNTLSGLLAFAVLAGLTVSHPSPVDLGRQSANDPPVSIVQGPATFCCTQYVRCPLPAPQPPGTPCICNGPRGPMSGYACY